MDNLFVLQKQFLNDKYNPDGVAIKHLLDAYTRLNLDRYIITDDISRNNQEILKSRDKRMKIIPIGNIEFVLDGLKQELQKSDVIMPPIEIPKKLRHYAKREYDIIQGKDIPKPIIQNSREWFIKDADHLKKWNNLLLDGSSETYIDADTNYVVSQRVPIAAEYRVFVYKNEIKSIQNYLGEPLVMPASEDLLSMVNTYKMQYSEKPEAYTMDIAVFQGYTGLLEIHPFVSCGLYGFYDQCMLKMFEKGYEWYLLQNQE